MQPNITGMASQALSTAPNNHRAALDGIAYSVGESAFGNILVARDAQGICAILIGSRPVELKSDLAKRFPQSELVRDDRELDDALQKVLRFVETPSSGLNSGACNSRYAVSAARVGGTDQGPSGPDHHLRGTRRTHWPTVGSPGGSQCLRGECYRARDPMPSCR